MKRLCEQLGVTDQLLGQIPLPLADGSQYWTDQLWRRGYRLQSHARGDRWRVVSPRGWRRYGGSHEEALRHFQLLAGPPASGGEQLRAVILLHGLFRTRRCMKPMAAALGRAGFEPLVRMDYASTRRAIDDQAAALRRLTQGLPPAAQLNFVGHSMGNIVLRRALHDWQQLGDPGGVLPRLGRIVMLGPPNQGAAIARLLSRLRAFREVTGQGGMQLGPDFETLRPLLATPPCPFAVVAGDLSSLRLGNPLVGGPGDLIVSVDEARLQGATEFVTMPVSHTWLMTHRRVIQYTTEFLLGEHRPATTKVAA